MPISLRNRRAEELAREVAERLGTSMTGAIVEALEEKLVRLEQGPVADSRLQEILRISMRCSTLPLLDERSEDEILGYGDSGA
jgi:antitoxin VapB